MKTRIRTAVLLSVLFLFTTKAEALGVVSDDNSPYPLDGRRGINASLNKGFSPDDIPKLKNWGVNLLRLVLNADPKMRQYDSVYEANGLIASRFLERLDSIVDAAGKAGLLTILDMHTFPGYHDGLIWTDKRYWDSLSDSWAQIAAHFAGNNAVVGYDLINEPNIAASLGSERHWHVKRILQGIWKFPHNWSRTPRDYFLLVTKIAERINNIDPEKLVIIEGVGLGGRASNFIWMKPLEALNIVYSFHSYVPRDFTDSGKEGKETTTTYDSSIHRSVLEQEMSYVEAFARRYNARVFVGEFGLTYYTEGRGAGAWIRDMVTIMERNHWSWAYWSYSFALRNPEVVLLDGRAVTVTSSERLDALRNAWDLNTFSKD